MPKSDFNSNGYILWKGPSQIDGTPIVVIATGFDDAGSQNSKTGGMIQTWILRQDMNPWEAVKAGLSSAVCGSCDHQKFLADGSPGLDTCYVRVYQAPYAVYECWKRGRYAPLPSADVLRGLKLRLGSYGDPAAAPASMWAPLVDVTEAHTGYTHQWRQPWASPFKELCQASCDGMRDYIEATADGWGTFLVVPAGTKAPKGAQRCPASAEAGHKTTCFACTACDGVSARNVIINAHGSRGGAVVLRN